MKKNVVLVGFEARDQLAAGAKFLADAVSSTLGPFGQNFFLEKKLRPTNDGVTISREIQISRCIIHKPVENCDCPFEIQNLGASAIREAAIKTVDEVGDGTSTASTLAWEIYRSSLKFLGKDGVVGKKTPSEVAKQIEEERKDVTEKLVSLATQVETEEDLVNSAVVATEDKDLGKLIGSAQWELGKNGVLLAEETAERTSSVERIYGIRIDNGFGTSMIVNNQEKQTLEVEDSAVILTSYTLKNLKPIEGIINQLVKNGKTVITVIARAWTEEGIKVCLENINNSAVKIYPLNAPYVDMQQRFLDLQAVVGAKFFDSESSQLEDMQLTDVGFAKKIVARRFDAIITGTNDVLTLGRIDKRLEEIQEKEKGSESEFEKKMLQERAAQLKDGFAIVKVGSPSDMERKRLFDKAEDAVSAVRAAFQEGTVKGAGLAFKEIAEELPETSILKIPLVSIYNQILSQAPVGWSVEDWVRDPVKVLRVALEKACAAASSFATAGGAIAQKIPSEMDTVFRRSLSDAE